jgi:hypothetical protein
MKITVSRDRCALSLDLASPFNDCAIVTQATYFYVDGTQATCAKLNGPFIDRESAAYYTELYHHIKPTKEQLNDSEWSGEPYLGIPLVAGPKFALVAKVVVQVWELEVPYIFFTHFERERLAKKETS